MRRVLLLVLCLSLECALLQKVSQQVVLKVSDFMFNFQPGDKCLYLLRISTLVVCDGGHRFVAVDVE